MPETKTGKLIAKKIALLFRWLVIGAILLYIVKIIADNLPQLRQAAITLKPLPIFFSSLCYCLALLISALLWYLLSRFGNCSLPIGKSLKVWFYSMLGKYIPGKVFVLASRISFYAEHGHSMRKISFLFFIEIIVQLLAALILMMVAIAVTFVSPLDQFLPLILLLICLLILCINPRILQYVINIALTLFGKEKIIIPLSFRQLALTLGGHFINLFLFGAALYIFIDGIYPLQPQNFLYILATYLFAGWIGIFSLFAPSGLGVREGILYLSLQILMPQGIAAMLVIALRLWSTICEGLLTAFISLVGYRQTQEREPPQQS